MKLQAHKRTNNKKSEVAVLRRAGKIPAVLYGAAEGLLAIEGEEFREALRGIKQGHLATTVFTLVLEGKEKKVIVKGIQYHPTTYAVLHLDFQEVTKNSTVKINVPVVCTGVADCVGVKLGGLLRPVIRSIGVECSGIDAIPEAFTVNVKDLEIGQTKRLSDLVMPKGVKPLAAMNEVVVVIARS